MSKTFFLNFNQKNRDKFILDFSRTIEKNKLVLDVGAGSSPYRNLFERQIYKTHDFQKLSPGQLLHKQGYGQIDFVSDIVSIPVESSSFDVILCTEVLEHVPEPIAALKEMARILKKGGEIVITTPLGSHVHQEPYHYYGGFTPFFYKKFLEENGFEKIGIYPNQGFFNFYFQETLRFLKISCKNHISLILLVFTLPIVLFFLLTLFFTKNLFDKLYYDYRFTVGYHIHAIKGK
jgi:ubiquinone/menaquinone biosynthesis C-methylase UbiE